MANPSITSTTFDKQREEIEFKDLKNLFAMKGEFSEEVLNSTWKSLKEMQKELELPSLYPMKYHYYFYLRLCEIQKVLTPLSINFQQLHQLYIEINYFRDILGLPITSSLSEVINLIRKKPLQELLSLEVDTDSLFLKTLLLQSTIKNTDSGIKDIPVIIHRLDNKILEILISYGPCTRSELVETTGAARSSIYDSLRRLELKGKIITYSDRKKNVGRPMTLFDALI